MQYPLPSLRVRLYFQGLMRPVRDRLRTLQQTLVNSFVQISQLFIMSNNAEEMDNASKELEEFILSGRSNFFRDVAKILDVMCSSACGENENFLGQVLRMTCEYESISGSVEKMNVIVKKAPNENNPFAKLYVEYKVFQEEINMYENVLANMKKIIDEGKCESWKFWPNYFGHSDKDIYLEDLCINGFNSYPKGKPLGLQEALQVMTSLGRMHGLSLSLVQRRIYDPSGMPPNSFVRLDSALKRVETDTLDKLAAHIESSWGNEWESFPGRLRKFSETIGQKANNLWYETRGKKDVINHGDCWIFNMLFKYDDENNAVDMRFVDYQACHYNSCAWDLMQVLSSGITITFREQNLDLLLTAYLHSLSETTEKTKYTGPTPTLQELKEDLDLLSPCSLIRSIITFSYFISGDASKTVPEVERESTDKDELPDKIKENTDILQKILIYFDYKNAL